MNYANQHLKKYLQSASKTKHLLLILSALYSVLSYAQTPAEPPLLILDVSEPPLRYTPATVIAQLSASATQGEEMFAPQNIQLNLTTGATQGLNKIAVLLGSSAGSNDVFYKEFAYQTTGNFADGTSYSSNGNSITLSLSNPTANLPLYAEVFGIMSDGKRSKPKRVVVQ